MNQAVLGATINSLRYAFKTNTSVIYESLRVPHRFSGGDLEEFSHLAFCLSLSGKMKKASQIRIVDDGLRLTVGRKASVIKDTEFLFFDDAGVSGLPPRLNRDSMIYEVLDWINVRSGMKHEFETLWGFENSFVERVHFYPSDRIDGNHNLKDACAVSYLTEKQLEDFKFSELMSRFATELAMAECGITGSSNGVGRFMPIKLESSHREKFPVSRAEYADLPEGFVVSDEETGEYPKSESGYLNYLMSGVKGD